MRKTKNNWVLNHPKPSLAKNKPETEDKLLEDDEDLLSVDEKTKMFLKKIPKGQEEHIKHVIDRQEFIEKKSGVKKPKTFELPPEITNMIYASVQKKLQK